MLGVLTKQNFGQLLQRFSTNQLEEMVRRYPYFHQAHLLLAKKYQVENNPRYDEQLQMAALYAQNRDLLFEIFMAKEQPVLTPTFTTEEVTGVSLTELTAEITRTEQDTVLENTEPQSPPNELPSETILQTAVEEDIVNTKPLAIAEPEVVSVAEYTPHQEPILTKEAEPELQAEDNTVALTEPHTFDEWLQYFSGQKLNTAALSAALPETQDKEPEPDELEKLYAANITADYLHDLVKEETHYSKGLDEFIEAQIKKHKPVERNKSSSENEISPDLATETLAAIYEQQKKYQRAIAVYQALSLKNPAKSDLFAARIEKLKNLI